MNSARDAGQKKKKKKNKTQTQPWNVCPNAYLLLNLLWYG